MPRRRPQPGTPPRLPPIPEGAYKKAYYPYPDTVYFLAEGVPFPLVMRCRMLMIFRRGCLRMETWDSQQRHKEHKPTYGQFITVFY